MWWCMRKLALRILCLGNMLRVPVNAEVLMAARAFNEAYTGQLVVRCGRLKGKCNTHIHVEVMI